MYKVLIELVPNPAFVLSKLLSAIEISQAL